MAEPDPDRVEVLPVLPSLNLEETLAFYRDDLGFDRILHQSPDYLILRRDEMDISGWRATERYARRRPSICVAVELPRCMRNIK